MKKIFNLKEYKTAEKIEGPNLEDINVSNLDLLKEKLQKKYPNIIWTIEKVKEWANKHFIGKPKDFKPKDTEHYF